MKNEKRRESRGMINDGTKKMVVKKMDLEMTCSAWRNKAIPAMMKKEEYDEFRLGVMPQYLTIKYQAIQNEEPK